MNIPITNRTSIHAVLKFNTVIATYKTVKKEVTHALTKKAMYTTEQIIKNN